jgi:hypothetical protein
MNVENYKKVLDKIKGDPDSWKQSSWHCGTKHCFFGHAQIESGKPAVDDTVRRDARLFLQLGYADANYLSAPERTMGDFEDFLEIDRDGYGRAGYDRDGYNRAGYDRDGYDRAGYDRDGYGRAGYDRAGYDRDGYDRDGYGRAGYDRDGYDRAGYDGDGLLWKDGVLVER